MGVLHNTDFLLRYFVNLIHSVMITSHLQKQPSKNIPIWSDVEVQLELSSEQRTKWHHRVSVRKSYMANVEWLSSFLNDRSKVSILRWNQDCFTMQHDINFLTLRYYYTLLSCIQIARCYIKIHLSFISTSTRVDILSFDLQYAKWDPPVK